MAFQFVQGFQLQQQQQQGQQKEDKNLKHHFTDLSKVNLPTFDGTTDPNLVEQWLSNVEKKFKTMQVSEDIKPQVVTSFLVGEAEKWWNGMALICNTPKHPLTWSKFKEVFLKTNFPPAIWIHKIQEFNNFKQNQTCSC
mgnify:CR=1 FL=1